MAARVTKSANLPPSATASENRTFTKYFPLTKVDVQEDGTLRISGIVTKQEIDRDMEICDYESTKPYYKARAEQMLKTTSVEGMEQSEMPLREMHQLITIGKGVPGGMDFDDDNQQIRMVFEVVTPDAIKKVRKGLLACFSHGGRVVDSGDAAKKYDNKSLKGIKWYTANPGEISLVDLGSCPSAVVDSIKGQTFQLCKADGTTRNVKFKKAECQCPCAECTEEGNCDGCLVGDCEAFGCGCHDELSAAAYSRIVDRVKKEVLAQLPKTDPHPTVSKEAKTKRVAGEDLTADCFAYVGDKDSTDTWKLPIKFSGKAKSKRHIANALARFDQTEGIPAEEKESVKAKIVAAAKEHGIEVAEKAISDTISAAIEKKFKPLAKGLWEVGRFAELAASFGYLLQSMIWERDVEGDESIVPDELQGHIEGLLDTLVAYVQEEVEEAKEAAAAANKAQGDEMNKEQIEAMLKAALAEVGVGFEKAGKSLASHFTKKAAHHAGMEKCAMEKADHHEAMAESMKAETGDLAKSHSAHKGLAKAFTHEAGLHKAMSAHYEKMAKSHVGTEAKADDGELQKGFDMAAFGEMFKSALQDGLKPLQDEIALLKAKQIVDPGNKEVAKAAPKLIEVPRDGQERAKEVTPEIGEGLTKGLYSVARSA